MDNDGDVKMRIGDVSFREYSEPFPSLNNNLNSMSFTASSEYLKLIERLSDLRLTNTGVVNLIRGSTQESKKDLLSVMHTRTLYLFAWALFIYSLYQLLKTIDLELFFNSDILYLPTLYRDLFVDGYSIAGWRLTPAPYFFPDMGVFFTLMYITGNTALSFILFGAIQSTALVLAYAFIARTILKNHKNQAMIFMLIVGSIVNIMLMNNLGTEIFSYILMPTIIFALSFLGVVSDKIFIVLFILPIMGTMFFLYLLDVIPRKDTINLLIAIIPPTIVGIASISYIRHFVTIPGTTSIKIGKFITSVWKLYGNMGYFITGNMRYYTINYILWLTITVMLINFYVKNIRDDNNFLENKPENLQLLFFTVFSAVMVLIVIFATLVKGYLCTLEFRYMTAVFMIPMLGNAIYISYYFYTSSLSKKKKNLIMTALVTVSCVVTLWIKHDFSGKLSYDYYPKQVRSLDYYCSENNLSFGLSGYWNAKLITVLSKKNVRLCQLGKKDLSILHWINNKEWYFNKGKNGKEKPKFNFIVLSRFDKNSEIKKYDILKELRKQISPSGLYYRGLDRGKIIKKFGFPIRTVKLNRLEILIYERSLL